MYGENSNEGSFRKSRHDISITLTDKTLLGVNKTKIKRTPDNLFYISQLLNADDTFYVYDYMEFAGSKISHETNTRGNARTQGRMGSALVGGALFGPLGAVMGASRSKHSKINANSITKQTEKPGKGTVYLRSTKNGSIKKVFFQATQNEAMNIERFFNEPSHLY